MRRSPRLIATAVAAVVALPLMIVAPVAAEGGGDRGGGGPEAPVLDWVPCFEEITAVTGTVFECADAEVPLDYDRPWSRTITIALTRIPAADPENRVGSIMLNPGGPGGSGVDFVTGFGPFVGQALGPDVPARFDLVGFDPRGIARSSPIRCFDTFEDAVATFADQPFPLTRAEERDARRGVWTLGLSCLFRRDARTIGKHMSTANVARDMDLIREAMGDAEMNFLGLSYGTFLGATYVNLFPDRVRSVVVDGVLDPIAWVNAEAEVPFSTRLRSDKGAQDTLDEFFAQCDAAAPGNCALAPNSAGRFDAITAALLDEPLVLPTPDGEFVLTYQIVVSDTLSALYSAFDYANFAGALASLEPVLADRTNRTALDTSMFRGEGPEQEEYPNVAEGFPAVACVDTNNPRSFRTWSTAGAAADEEFGYFGRLWTWASIPCARWLLRDRDRYVGPFDGDTPNPVLVIGNLYDPATLYEGAQSLREILPNSALLTVDVPGHTSLGLSQCAGFLTGQFLLDPATAAAIDGVTCPAEFNAFDVVAPPPPSPETTRTTDVAVAADVGSLVDARNAINDLIGVSPGR